MNSQHLEERQKSVRKCSQVLAIKHFHLNWTLTGNRNNRRSTPENYSADGRLGGGAHFGRGVCAIVRLLNYWTSQHMASTRTSEQTRQAHIETLGDTLGPLYHALWNELAWLYAKWGEYVEVFGTKPSRIELVNSAAPHFFRIVQDSIWDDCLLHIARLTDPPRSAGKENLTVRRLPEVIERHELRASVAKLVDHAVDTASFCRDWRNRRIAHRDLKLALEAGAERLEPASRAKVKSVLESLSDVLNSISTHYMNSKTRFEGVGSYRGALDLLHVIGEGLQAQEAQRQRVMEGDIRPEDDRKRDL